MNKQGASQVNCTVKINISSPRILSISSHFLISLTYFRWNALTLGLSWKTKQVQETQSVRIFNQNWMINTHHWDTPLSPGTNHHKPHSKHLYGLLFFTAAFHNTYDLCHIDHLLCKKKNATSTLITTNKTALPMLANSAVTFKVRLKWDWKPWTYISELHQSQFSQFTDAVVRGSGLQEQLGQTHLLAPEQGAHFDSSPWCQPTVLILAS